MITRHIYTKMLVSISTLKGIGVFFNGHLLTLSLLTLNNFNLL